MPMAVRPDAGDGMGFEAERFDAVADGADLFVGGVGLHDNEHEKPRMWCEESVMEKEE